MSVLEDVNTENGLAVHNLSLAISNSIAERYMNATAKHDLYRLLGIEYCQSDSDFPAEAVPLANHHWRTDDGYNWGTPYGSYKAFVHRLISYKQDWKGGQWWPHTRRSTTEVRARDLLAASYLFPFRVSESEVVAEHGILPLLEHGHIVISGCKAVATLVDAVNRRTEMFSVLEELKSVDPKKDAAKWMDFGAWASHFETSTSVNPNDDIRAGIKAGAINKQGVFRSADYVLLADFANTVGFVMRASGRRGSIGKNAQHYREGVERAKNNFTKGQLPHVVSMYKDELADAESAIVRDFVGNPRKKSLVYATQRSKQVRMLAVGNVCLVQLRAADPWMLLTEEDVKSLKFVAMSHSMWHFYAATLDMEYIEPTKILRPVDEEKVVRAATALGQLGATLADWQDRVYGHAQRATAAKVYSKKDCHKLLEAIWRFYSNKVEQFLGLGMQDYLGKYLNDIFSVYTTYLGGHLSAGILKAQKADAVEFWSKYDIDVTYDMNYLLKLYARAPITMVQDFGRLAKIIFPYDIDGTYAYIKRVKDMQDKNPRGKAEFTSEFDYNLTEETEPERLASEIVFKCAATVMIAVADARSVSSASLSADDAANLNDQAFPNLIDYLRRNGLTMRYSSIKLAAPKFNIPLNVRGTAKAQADEFYDNGTMPSSYYAGAYMDVSNIFSYKVRGDPDLADIKASSLPSSKLRECLSSIPGMRRCGPTRDTDGQRPLTGGNMISSYLHGVYPSRKERLKWLSAKNNWPIASTSVKIETAKCPIKNRIITSCQAEARGTMSEYEFNNGQVLKAVPGFSVGADPAHVKSKMYAAMRDDVRPDYVRLLISLDLSSWSTGMHWDIQKWCNEVLEDAYDGGEDMFRVLDKCTKGSVMIYTQKGVKLAFRNVRGANYEGVDGKRNTFMHSTLWYIARCNAYDEGVIGSMRALLFIDDGSAVIDVPKKDYVSSAAKLRSAMLKTYVRFGFKLSIMKTVISTTYIQFLNEIYFYGAHIGYGFRALCHTGAQTFPVASNVVEELAVISSGIRGAAVSGGHTTRLSAGYHQLLMLYVSGVIGNLGKSLHSSNMMVLAIALILPTIGGGFGQPSLTELYSNLAGHRDIEKLAKIQYLLKAIRKIPPLASVAVNLKEYVKGNLLKTSTIAAKKTMDRLTVPHAATTGVSSRNRDTMIAESALKIAKNPEAKKMLRAYLKPAVKEEDPSFVAAFISAAKTTGAIIPSTIVERALGSDPDKSIQSLVKKIVSSSMVSKFLRRDDLSKLCWQYRKDATTRVQSVYSHVL